MTDNTLPDPLVPADVDLRDFGYMPLDALRLRDSELAIEASPEVFRASVLLWCASWHQVPAGSLPRKDKTLAEYSRAGTRWPRIRDEVLSKWVECSDGRLYHPVVAEKAREAQAAKDSQRARTKAATEAREAKRRVQPQPRDEQRDDTRNVDRDEQRDVERNVVQGKGREGKGTEGIKETTAASRLVDRSADAPPDDPQRSLPETGPNPKPYAVPDCPYEAIVDAYHDALAMLPRVTVLNDARREHMRARWREVCADARFDAAAGLEWFRWYFGHAASSSFLTGRGSSRGRERPFTANFDWLLLPTNFAKVIDGNYLDSRAIA